MKLLVSLLAALALAASLATAARADNAPDTRLDQVVTEIAGKPADAWCETDQAAWIKLVQLTNAPDDQGNPVTDPNVVLGVTIFSLPRAFLSPRVCLELRSALNDPAPAQQTDVTLGMALIVLLHEAEHVAGILGAQDSTCAGFLVAPHYATALLGIPAKITTARTVTRIKRVRVHGRWVNRRVRVTVESSGPNPAYVEVLSQAQAAAPGCPTP